MTIDPPHHRHPCSMLPSLSIHNCGWAVESILKEEDVELGPKLLSLYFLMYVAVLELPLLFLLDFVLVSVLALDVIAVIEVPLAAELETELILVLALFLDLVVEEKVL